MRHRSSSIRSWIGLILVSSTWLACYAYANGRAYENPGRLEESAGTGSLSYKQNDYAVGLADQSAHTAGYTTKKQVSIPETNIGVLNASETRASPTINEPSNEDVAHSEINLKILDDLPETIEQTIQAESPSGSEVEQNENNDSAIDLPGYFAQLANILSTSEFWNSLTQRFTQSGLSEALRSFFGLEATPSADVFQIDENAVRQKRHNSASSSSAPCSTDVTPCATKQSPIEKSPPVAPCAAKPPPVVPCSTKPSKALSASKLVAKSGKELNQKKKSDTSEGDVGKCVGDAVNELQNLMNQFKTACSNIQDNLSIGLPSKSASSCSSPSPCQSPSIMQSAPALIQTLMDDPDQIVHIPEIVQSSVPCDKMANSMDNLKESVKKIFGMLQENDSEEYQEDDDEESESCDKTNKSERSSKHSDGWKCKKSRRRHKHKCGKCASNNCPNTVILTVPGIVPNSSPKPTYCTTAASTCTPYSISAYPSAQPTNNPSLPTSVENSPQSTQSLQQISSSSQSQYLPQYLSQPQLTTQSLAQQQPQYSPQPELTAQPPAQQQPQYLSQPQPATQPLAQQQPQYLPQSQLTTQQPLAQQQPQYLPQSQLTTQQPLAQQQPQYLPQSQVTAQQPLAQQQPQCLSQPQLTTQQILTQQQPQYSPQSQSPTEPLPQQQQQYLPQPQSSAQELPQQQPQQLSQPQTSPQAAPLSQEQLQYLSQTQPSLPSQPLPTLQSQSMPQQQTLPSLKTQLLLSPVLSSLQCARSSKYPYNYNNPMLLSEIKKRTEIAENQVNLPLGASYPQSSSSTPPTMSTFTPLPETQLQAVPSSLPVQYQPPSTQALLPSLPPPTPSVPQQPPPLMYQPQSPLLQNQPLPPSPSPFSPVAPPPTLPQYQYPSQSPATQIFNSQQSTQSYNCQKPLPPLPPCSSAPTPASPVKCCPAPPPPPTPIPALCGCSHSVPVADVPCCEGTAQQPKNNSPTKGKSKFGKFRRRRHISKRSYGSDCTADLQKPADLSGIPCNPLPIGNPLSLSPSVLQTNSPNTLEPSNNVMSETPILSSNTIPQNSFSQVSQIERCRLPFLPAASVSPYGITQFNNLNGPKQVNPISSSAADFPMKPFDQNLSSVPSSQAPTSQLACAGLSYGNACNNIQTLYPSSNAYPPLNVGSNAEDSTDEKISQSPPQYPVDTNTQIPHPNLGKGADSVVNPHIINSPTYPPDSDLKIVPNNQAPIQDSGYPRPPDGNTYSDMQTPSPYAYPSQNIAPNAADSTLKMSQSPPQYPSTNTQFAHTNLASGTDSAVNLQIFNSPIRPSESSLKIVSNERASVQESGYSLSSDGNTHNDKHDKQAPPPYAYPSKNIGSTVEDSTLKISQSPPQYPSENTQFPYKNLGNGADSAINPHIKNFPIYPSESGVNTVPNDRAPVQEPEYPLPSDENTYNDKYDKQTPPPYAYPTPDIGYTGENPSEHSYNHDHHEYQLSPLSDQEIAQFKSHSSNTHSQLSNSENKFGSVADVFSDFSSLLLPNSPNDKSQFSDKLKETSASMMNVITDASSLLMLDSEDDSSPFKIIGDTAGSMIGVLSDVSSLLLPETESRESPLDNIGHTAGSVMKKMTDDKSSLTSEKKDGEYSLDKMGQMAGSAIGQVSDATSLSMADSADMQKLGHTAENSPFNAIDEFSKNTNSKPVPLSVPASSDNESTLPAYGSSRNDSPLNQLTGTAASLVEAMSDATLLLTPSPSDDESPMKRMENAATAIVDVLSGLSSYSSASTSGTSKNSSPSEESQNPIDILADSVSAVASLLNSRMQNRQQNQRNNQPSAFDNKSPLKSTSQTSSAFVNSVSYSSPAYAPQEEQNTNNLISALKSPSKNTESPTSSILNSISSMCNSAAIVANTLSSTVTQLASDNQQNPLLKPTTPSSPQVVVYRPASQPSLESNSQISLTLPRDQVCGAISGGTAIPGDIVTITLNDQSVLVGKVLDFSSPIAFNLVKNNNYQPAQPQGNQIWNIPSSGCKDKNLEILLQTIRQRC